MKNRLEHVARWVLILAMVVANFQAPLLAQTTPRQTDLTLLTIEELMNLSVSTASRRAEPQTEAPARVQIVTAAQIQRRGYRSLLDVLRDLPDFKVDVRGNWDFPAELTVQGVRGTGRVVVLVDGVRVSAPTNEPLPIGANYPVQNARQVEIVYGPVSAMYGADAFSAVINIITRSASDIAGLSAGTSVGTFGLYNQTVSYGKPVGDGGLVIAGQYQYDEQPDLSRYYPNEFNGLQAQHAGVFPTIFGVMVPSRPISPEYHIPMWAGSLQASYRRDGLHLSLFENRSHLPATAGIYTPDNVVYNDGAFLANSLIVGAGSYTREIHAVTSTSSVEFSRHQLDPHSGYMDLYSNMNRSYKYAYGSMLKGEQQVAWKPVGSVTMTTGATVERFFAIPQTADLNAPIESRAAPGTILGTDIVDNFFKLHYTNAGAFAEMRYAMRPGIVLTAGGRSDYNTRYGGTFNPRAGLVVEATTTTTLKLLYGTAYLAPSPYQAYQHYGSFLSDDGGKTFYSSYWHLPNPDLKPEHKKTVEANVVQRVGPYMSISGSAFYSRFTNLIQSANIDQASAGEYHGWPVESIEFPTNEGRETTYGATVALEMLKSISSERQIAAHAGITVADGRIWRHSKGDASLPLGGMAPVQLRLGTDIDWDRFSLAPRISIVGSQRFPAPSADGIGRRTISGFVTSDLTVRRHSVVRHLDMFTTVENAFDRRYRTINERAHINAEEFIGIPQNPRRITAGVELRLP